MCPVCGGSCIDPSGQPCPCLFDNGVNDTFTCWAFIGLMVAWCCVALYAGFS